MSAGGMRVPPGSPARVVVTISGFDGSLGPRVTPVYGTTPSLEVTNLQPPTGAPTKNVRERPGASGTR